MFNTLKYARMLEEVGFSREQAETSINILDEVMDTNFATKQDIEQLKAATKQDIEQLKAATKQDIEQLKAATKQDIFNLEVATKHEFKELINAMGLLESRMTIRLGTMLAASIAVLTAIQKLL